MSKSIGKLLRGDYAPMPIENNFNKNRRVNYFELFGKNEQSYIEPTPAWEQRLYQKQNMSYLPAYDYDSKYSSLNVPKDLQQTNDWEHKWKYTKNFVNDFKSGWNEGFDLGVENIVNTASGGKYAELNQALGGDYLSRKDKYYENAKLAGTYEAAKKLDLYQDTITMLLALRGLL